MSPSSVATPTRPPNRPLGDLTNTPSPLPEVRRSGEPRRRDDDAGTVSTAVVQRFSLKSRRVGPKEQGSNRALSRQGSETYKVAAEVLWTTPQFSFCSLGQVRICPCSQHVQAEGPRLGGNAGFEARRLCQRDTEDHCEYRLLEVMSRSFVAECGHTPSVRSLAAVASLHELEAYFIVKPSSDLVIGYAAIRPAVPSRAGRYTPTLEEVFVDLDFRRCGVATAALRVLLAGQSSVALGKTPDHAVEPTRGLLRGLGFSEHGSLVFVRSSSDGNCTSCHENAL